MGLGNDPNAGFRPIGTGDRAAQIIFIYSEGRCLLRLGRQSGQQQ